MFSPLQGELEGVKHTPHSYTTKIKHAAVFNSSLYFL